MKKKDSKTKNLLIELDDLIAKGETIHDRFSDVLSEINLDDDLIEKINNPDNVFFDEYKKVFQFNNEIKDKIKNNIKKEIKNKKVKNNNYKKKLKVKKIKKTRLL